MKRYSRKTSFVLASLVILVAGCGSGGGSSVSDPGSTNDGTLSTILETARASHNVPALATVFIENGVIVEMGAVGTRVFNGQEAVTTSDQWHIGSITKSMTSTLAAVLIERGVVDWDTTIADVLLVDVPAMRNEYRNVTVEQLMAHTGGLPFDITLAPSFQNGDVSDTSALPMSQRRLVWSSDLLQMQPDAAVGTHLYSNGNYIVLGTMIEKLTGESWEDLIERELFAPLGMTNSGFGPPGVPGARLQPWGHASQGGGWQALDPGDFNAGNASSLGPAGNVHTTLQDFAAYASAHLAGDLGEDGLVEASTFARLHSPQVGTDYASGWVVNTDGWLGRSSFWHNGSNRRWFAHTVISAERNAAVFVVTNADSRAVVEDFIGVMIRRSEAASN